MVMSKPCKGSLTIEASVVMPFILMLLFGLLYFGKIYYIQDQVHSAMTKVAHQMATDAYIVDQIGLVDLQQGLYTDGAKALDSTEESISHLYQQAQQIQEEVNGLTDYGGKVGSFAVEMKGIKAGTLAQTIESGIEIIEEAPRIVEHVTVNMKNMITSIEVLMTDVGPNLMQIGLMEVIDLANGVVAEKMVERKMSDYLSEEALEAWDIVGGQVYFDASQYLLVDDTITITAVYQIELPFGISLGDVHIPVFQTITARAWTGSYDANDHKYREKIRIDNQVDDTSYYIANNTEDNYAYHLYSCLRKDLKYGSYKQIVELSGREVCKYCSTHYQVPGGDAFVFFTSLTSKAHYNDQCPRVFSSKIVAVTEEEALALGKTPCKKFGCVDEMKKEEE